MRTDNWIATIRRVMVDTGEIVQNGIDRLLIRFMLPSDIADDILRDFDRPEEWDVGGEGGE